MTARRRNDAATASKWGITKAELWKRRRAGLKGCGLCREWLPTEQFNRSSSRGDGLQPNCAACTAAQKREARR